MVSNELFYTIALSMIPGIGHIKARKLIEHCEGAESLFEEYPKLLKKFGSKKISWKTAEIVELAKKEVEYLLEAEVNALSYSDDQYPKRLKECIDHPLVLYSKGKIDLNRPLVLSIVGSRKATIMGKEICKSLIADLAPHQPLIVSGLAYGIDVTAHQSAVDQGLQTVGVLGSGLKIIYPSRHTEIANRMMKHGGILSDYPSETKLLPSQFAERNRIVAGLSDATIVIESTKDGGSLITARLALDYNREVMAIPGRPKDELSEGCNQLIKNDRAALIESAKDVEYLLGLDQKNKKEIQTKLFEELNEVERKISKKMSREIAISIDDLSIHSGLPIHQTSVVLLDLEFKGIVRSLPGKRYQLV